MCVRVLGCWWGEPYGCSVCVATFQPRFWLYFNGGASSCWSLFPSVVYVSLGLSVWWQSQLYIFLDFRIIYIGSVMVFLDGSQDLVVSWWWDFQYISYWLFT